jgi:hypothetical protein
MGILEECLCLLVVDWWIVMGCLLLYMLLWYGDKCCRHHQLVPKDTTPSSEHSKAMRITSSFPRLSSSISIAEDNAAVAQYDYTCDDEYDDGYFCGDNYYYNDDEKKKRMTMTMRTKPKLARKPKQNALRRARYRNQLLRHVVDQGTLSDAAESC